MRVDTVRDLADRRGVAPPSALDADGVWRFADPAHFIDSYGAVCNLLHDLDEFRRIAYELCEDLSAHGVRYAEVVFSPAQHADRLGDWYGPIEAVLDGFAAGERDTGVIARVEPDVIRDYGLEHAEEVLQVALKYVGRGVVSLNCAGSEGPPIAPYADIFRRAVEGGLHSTPHAGEWSGPENVWATLEHLRPERIGHGVRSIDDPRLVEHLAEAPDPVGGLSDVQRRHRRVRRRSRTIRSRGSATPASVVTLNSDDPAMFGSWVSDEYRVARDVFGYDDADLADIAATSVRASFADDGDKRLMLRDIAAWLADG